MKKWNSLKRLDNINQNDKSNRCIKNSNSTTNNKDASKIYKKIKSKVVTSIKLFKLNKKSNESINKNNYHKVYQKKHILDSPVKIDSNYKKKQINRDSSIKINEYHKKISSEKPKILFTNKYKVNEELNHNKYILNKDNYKDLKKELFLEFNNIENNSFIQKKKFKKVNSEFININKKVSLEETLLNYSNNSQLNDFINEINNKINISKRNIFKIQRMSQLNNLEINKNNDKICDKKILPNDEKENNSENIESSSIIINTNSELCSNIRQSKISDKSNIIPEQEDERIFFSKIKISKYPQSMIKTINKLYKSNYNIDEIISNIKNKNNYNFINNKYEPVITKYLDNKSLLLLSSTNKIMFKNIRVIIYKVIYDKILMNKTNDKNDDFVQKIMKSLFKYSSNKLFFRNNAQLKTKYNYYLITKSEFNNNIKQDLSRTFPYDSSFNTKTNYLKLYHILTAYSNYNKLIGYTQGINFIAATGLYLFNTEEEVFYFLDCLINRFQLEKY